MTYYSTVPEHFPIYIKSINFPEYIKKYNTWLLFDTKNEKIITINSNMIMYQSIIKVNIENHPYNEYWFRHNDYDDGLIIITDFLGVRVYDMKLNIKKEIKRTTKMETEGSVYGFDYNESNKELRIWIVDDNRLERDIKFKFKFDRYTEYYYDIETQNFIIE
jgi:hypothetical protein